MRTVHKFLVPSGGMHGVRPVSPLALHSQAKIVHTGPDPRTGMPAMWVEVISDWAGEPKDRSFAYFGTGCEIPAGWVHVGTAICRQFVWHVYEQVQR